MFITDILIDAFFAAVAGIVFSLVGKVSALLKSIPGPVLGGIMLLLFGTIATAGVANIQQHKVDLSNTRNIVIFSLTLTVGIGGATFTWGEFSLSGIGLAAIVGVILNLILPKSKDAWMLEKQTYPRQFRQLRRLQKRSQRREQYR